MDAKGIFDRLAGRFGDGIERLTVEGVKDPFFHVKPGRWLEVAGALRDDPELAFDFLNCVTAVDWIKQNVMQVVYHLYSYRHHHEAVVKVDLERAAPQVTSVCSVWNAANWLEREQYDLLGVEFLGHPELKRILMPDDWVGHPMRKDYKEAAEYRGMPTTRPSTFDLLAAFDKAHAKPEGNGA
jgi:NADH-quinone oxidoreductase subunit C